ncbi:MAG: ImmA/IrrE family metallo-endopeptidase [Pseudomonadota bacterium]
MNTTAKGDLLENEFYRYLLEQKSAGELIFDAHPAQLCKIYQKKRIFCSERNGDIEFDIVVEVRKTGRQKPHLLLIFECKNHSQPIQDRDLRDFSDKVATVARNGAKGVIVTRSPLQRGALALAESRAIGVVKFDQNGLEIVADRSTSTASKPRVQASIAETSSLKPFKFAGYCNGHYSASFGDFIWRLDDECSDPEPKTVSKVPFLENSFLEIEASKSLAVINYQTGQVDLDRLSESLGLSLHHSELLNLSNDEEPILGSVNFSTKTIWVAEAGNRNRARFTLAHEIGHFILRHDEFLRSETLVEGDLLNSGVEDFTTQYERLEHQANAIAGMILMPQRHFLEIIFNVRSSLGISNRGHGFIFVDDQPYNYTVYGQLLEEVSRYFAASKQAVEVRLKRGGLLVDERSAGCQVLGRSKPQRSAFPSRSRS